MEQKYKLPTVQCYKLLFFIPLHNSKFQNKMNNAQKFLLGNKCNDLVLNDKPHIKPDEYIYVSDIMEDYKAEYNNNIRLLKLLNIGYQAATSYDNCPNIEEAQEIKENEIFAEKLELSEIRIALEKYEGWSPSDFESKIVATINCL